MSLKEIVSAFGVPGYEDEIRELVRDKMERYADEVFVDTLGNVVGVMNGGDRKVMVAAHMDQIGFMVKSITDDGYLVISPIGGIHTSVLRSSLVRIRGKNGYIYGVIGEKPPHLGKEQKKVEFKDLRVDIGVSSRKDAEKHVSVGDVGSFATNYVEMGNRVVANSLDDRVGVHVLIETMKRVKSDSTLYFVATVQEEIGLKGARTSSYGLDPDVGIAVDVTHATMPGVGKEEVPIELGKGPVLSVGAVSHPKLLKHFLSVARKKKIPHQIEANPSWSGTDADIIQLSRAGVATSVVSIPERYMHSPVEMVDIRDVKNTVKLLVYSLESIGEVDLRL